MAGRANHVLKTGVYVDFPPLKNQGNRVRAIKLKGIKFSETAMLGPDFIWGVFFERVFAPEGWPKHFPR